MTTLTEEQIKNIWKEVIDTLQKGDIQLGEKTKNDIMVEHNLSVNQVERMLQKLLKQNKVTRRAIAINGRKTYVYKVVMDDTTHMPEH